MVILVLPDILTTDLLGIGNMYRYVQKAPSWVQQSSAKAVLESFLLISPRPVEAKHSFHHGAVKTIQNYSAWTDFASKSTLELFRDSILSTPNIPRLKIQIYAALLSAYFANAHDALL